MTRRCLLLFCVLVLACARDGHVLESEAAYPPAPSAGDVAQMCSESFLEVKGLTSTMRLDGEVDALLTAQFGRETAATLIRAIRDKHARVRRDEIFMYKESLCTTPGLPRRCSDACAEASELRKKP